MPVITEKFTKVGLPGSATYMAGSGHSIGGVSITLNSATNWEVTTSVHFDIYTTTTVGTTETENANSRTQWKGIVTGTTISSMQLKNGADQSYSAGTATKIVITHSAIRENEVIDGILIHANQDGSLITSAVQAALNIPTTPTADWTTLATPPNSVVNNGNRSYTLTFPGVDYTDRLNPGTRLRTTRTVAAPTQCTSLNGTTQYYSKTTPAGMTFTNNFVAGAWVKLSSYAAVGAIVSRSDGTNGWQLYIDTTGQVNLVGYNGSTSNNSKVVTHQSIPLNKWVHIAAQLDMLTFTSTPTTSYIMIDGVDVPTSSVRGGTLPTALIQAGNLEVGGWNGALELFNGKIAQAFVTSAKITQAVIRSNYYAQSISPTEANVISAYSFNNVITDLNTTNANNLIANGSAVATNADSPFGGQADGTISSILDYGIVQSVTFSTNTTVVVQISEGCTIPTSGGVSAVSYSSAKAPFGFPGQRGKWLVQSLIRTAQGQNTPTNGTWYNLGSTQVSIPIGEWVIGYEINLFANPSSSGGSIFGTLSTSNNGENDAELSTRLYSIGGMVVATVSRQKRCGSSLNAATIYYLNSKTDTATMSSINFSGDNPTIIYAENAYL
jgi:hypothetical protein